jgi:PST family polysaccharide transporter
LAIVLLAAIRTSLGISTDTATVGQTMRRPEEFLGGTTDRTLKEKTLRGGAIVFASMGLRLALRIGLMMILARLLALEDFGLQAMVLVVTGVLSMFRDAGLSLATVQRSTITHDQTSTLFWINGGLGVALAALLAVIAPALAAFYKEPRLQPVALVSALAFVLSGFGSQHLALLQRQIRFWHYPQ